jgi:hypothetical protein
VESKIKAQSRDRFTVAELSTDDVGQQKEGK